MLTPTFIFKMAVDRGYYRDNRYFMCHALDSMYRDMVISREEHQTAEESIQQYIKLISLSPYGPSNVIFPVVVAFGESPFTLEDYACATPIKRKEMRKIVCSPVFLDWDNRPFPK